jgi:hypothetical protein
MGYIILRAPAECGNPAREFGAENKFGDVAPR